MLFSVWLHGSKQITTVPTFLIEGEKSNPATKRRCSVNQVMQPIFNPDFSDSSYRFRPGRSAYDAVLKAREYATVRRRWVVDMDLEKLFDRVNHDILMAWLALKIGDEWVLRLIRDYLQAGVMV
jgi:RNA-directed DNA polymerase